MRKFIYYGVLIVLLTMFGNLSMAQLSVGVLDQTYTVDFDNTVEGVNNGTFAGIGFNPNPAEGQIDSDAVKVFGLSDSPMMSFGDTQEAGDFARGTTAGGVSTGGIYAGEYSSSPSDYFFMWQAGSSDMAAGMIMLKVQNNTGEEVTSVEIAYDILCLNDQGRSNSVMFYWSDDGATTYNQISELDYASPLAADASPVWTVTNKTTTISGLSIADGEEILLIWGTDDVGGSGSRDELGLDNIDVKLLPEANITITYPTSPETFYTNSSVTVTWTSVGVSNDVGLAVGPEGGLEGDFSFIGSTLASNGEFQLDIPNGVQFTDYVIIVYSDDNPDIYDITAAFDVVDNAGPNISETFPPNLGNEVAVYTELVINFDEDIALGTGNITIKYMADDAVFETLDVTGTQVNIGSEGDVLNIIPTTDLDFNTNFYVEIDNGAIEDLFGNSFAGITGNAIWSFTTEEEPIIIGSDCSNPIIVNIPEYAPYEELEQTTCGMLDTYSNTCLNSYDGGEDIIYLLDVSTASYVYIEMVPSVTYTGMALLDDCPDVGNCIESVTNSNSSPRIIETQLEPGTYYLMLDIWPSPDCFEFDLTIDVISCPNPSNLQEIAVSESSVTIGWDAGGLETNWEVQYGNQGFLIGEGDIVSVATNPETTISGLQGASTYDFYVRADCGGGDFSEWIGPITASTECGVISSFTYNQDFENAGDIPVCWVNDPDDGGGEWNFVTSNSHAASADHSDPGEYYAHVNAYLIDTYNNPINLISPVFDITSGDFKLVYYAWIGADSETNPLYIDISTDGGATWTEGVYTHDHSIVNQWFEVEVPLTAYTSSELVVRFRGISNYSYSMCNFGIDDVSIQEISTATPDWCNLQWPATMDINEGGTGTVYAQVYEPGVTDAVGQGAGIEAWIGYSEDDTDPATWTNWVPATYNSDNGNNDEYMADLGPLPIGSYYYASRFILDNGPDVYGGYSATGGGFWNGIDFVNGVLNVNAAVLTLPLFEDFELGFTYFANPAKSTDWTLNTTVYYSEVQSAHNAYAAYDDNVLYQTGNIDLTSTNNPELSFWQIAKTEGGYDYCYVEISTDGGATWNIIPETAYLGAGDYSSESFDEDSYTEWGTYTETPDNTWWKKEVFSLADYISNNEIRVRFRLTSDYGSQRAGWYIDDISIKDVTCPNPTDLAVNNIMATEADVSWTAGDTETLWNILYGPQGFDIGTEGTLISGVGNPYTLVSLTENTPYDVYVQADCSGGDYSEWAGPVTFTTLAACPAPIELYATNITSESAELGWNAVGGTDTWNVELGLPGFTPGNGEELVLITETNDNPVFVDGGTPNTEYAFYVQSVCGAETSDWAGPYEFSTTCGVFSVPYFEGFEDDVNFACWTILDIDGDDYGWSINTQDSYEGSQGVRSRWNSGGNDDWLISPQLAIDADNYALEFFAKSQSSSMLEDFEVLVSTTGTAPADFTNVLEVVTEHPNEWVKHLYKLSDYGINSGDNIYIAIHHTSIDEYYLHVDAFHVRALNEGNDIIDFVLAEQTGAANITGAPDYTVDIEVAMGTDMNGLIPTITVSPFATISPESGVPQDFSAPVVYTVTSETGTEQEWTVNVTEATTLSSENDIVDFVLPEQTGAAVIMGDPDYTVEIEVVWNADIANLTPTIVVSPLATISPESGVTQDFTNPVVYTVTAEDGTEQEWTVTVTQEEAPAGIFCDNPIVVSIPAEAPYLDEDQSNCGFGANYTETCLGSYDNGDGIVYRLDVTEASYVYIDLTTTTTWTGIALLDDCPDVGECITYETGYDANESIEAALMPGSYYILISTFPSPNCIPSFDLAITVDNNVCIAPINLAVVDLWQDEVTIEWEAGFLETSFNVLYGEAGFDPDTEGTLISGVTSPYTISDLISETEYDVYVQADCDSDWASITFTTLAACPAPIELYATNITSESAELGWNAVGGTDTWNVEYGVAGFTQGEGTLISATNDNPVFVDGLTPATTYEFYVQADCGAEQSIWVGPYAFFTECADAVLPIYQDFEDDSYLCWTAISNNEVNGPGGSGDYPMGIYFEDETETNKVLLFSSYSSATDYNQYLITPELPANAGLDISFDYAQGSSYSSGEVFRVGYSTTTSDLAEFTWGDEIVTVDTDIHEYIDVLPANTKFVAINYYSDYQYYLAVDNISISEIQLEDPTIAEIDVYTEVEDANVCLGALESEALDQLVDEITISDSDGGEHVVTVSWTIDSYNGDVADTYTATGTFELPTGVVQTDPETTLEVYADVVVNELPVVTCPDDFTVTTLDPVEISGESPQGGVYAGTGVTNGIFDPNGLENDNYVITYTYQDPTTGCENECEFTITLNYVGIETSSLAEISIYPNPNKGVFVMDLSNIEGKVYYQIYDTKGSVIISNEFVNYGGVEEFNLDVAPGIYYIQLRNAEQTINKKIVVH